MPFNSLWTTVQGLRFLGLAILGIVLLLVAVFAIYKRDQKSEGAHVDHVLAFRYQAILCGIALDASLVVIVSAFLSWPNVITVLICLVIGLTCARESWDKWHQLKIDYKQYM
jgi:Co/Zn/Cd efflux system component